MNAPLSVSRATVAQALCLSERRVAELVASGLLPQPVRPRNGFDLIATCRAYVLFLREKPNDLQAQRTRWTKAKADKSELELRVRQGELVAVADVKKDAFQAGRLVRDGLLAIPDRISALVAADFDHSKTHALLSREIRQALEALSDELSPLPNIRF